MLNFTRKLAKLAVKSSKEACIKACAAMAMLACTFTANADVIDFNSNTTFHSGAGVPYQEDGFQISNEDNNYLGLLFLGSFSANADPGGNTLSNNVGGTLMTLSRVDGTAFSFQSIDIAAFYNNTDGAEVRLGFYGVDGNQTFENVTLDNSPGLQQFSFQGKSNLLAMTWVASSAYEPRIQVDNIVLGAAISPVPEPESYALMLAGLGLMRGILRRRRSKLAVLI